MTRGGDQHAHVVLDVLGRVQRRKEDDKTLVPTAAAPAYLEPSLTPAAVVSMVEKVWAIATSARPRIAPSSIPTRKKKRRRGKACALQPGACPALPAVD